MDPPSLRWRDGNELKGKIVGLISVAGDSLSGIDALNGLRAICRSLRAWAIPQQVAIPEAWKAESHQKPNSVLMKAFPSINANPLSGSGELNK